MKLNKPNPSVTFSARIWLIDGSIDDLVVWVDALDEMSDGYMSATAWVTDHLQEFHSDYHTAWGIDSTERDYQIVIRNGKLESWHSGPDSEYEEAMGFPDGGVLISLIPQEYLEYLEARRLRQSLAATTDDEQLYELERYELHIQKYRVVATSFADAINKLIHGKAAAVEGATEYFETADEYGVLLDHGLRRELEQVGVQLIDGRVPSVRSVKAVLP